MRYVHNIRLSVFAKPGEDRKAIADALMNMLPFKDEKIKVQETRAEGFTGNISILELTITKEKHTNDFLDHLKEKLKGDLATIASQDNRLDDELFFYLRADKQSMLKGEWKLTESGDCFHIKMSIAAFPKNRSTASGVVHKMLSFK